MAVYTITRLFTRSQVCQSNDHSKFLSQTGCSNVSFHRQHQRTATQPHGGGEAADTQASPHTW